MRMYSVHALFNTLQGEGARAGTRAVFIRLAGCKAWNGEPKDRHLGKGACAQWCDTDFFKGDSQSMSQIIERIHQLWPETQEERWCVVTGGEPALQVDDEFIDALHSAGWKAAVETNGSIANSAFDKFDWVTVSPKLAMPWTLKRGHEL